MTVTVPSQREVRFDAQPVNAYRVSISDPKGSLAAAGLLDGDLIIGIDDTEFKDQQQMWAAASLARTKKSVTLIVLRGNARHRIVVEFSKIYGSPKAGGSLIQTSR